MNKLGNKYTNVDVIARDLVYGDDVELDDGRIVRLLVSDDDTLTTSMLDEDCFGKLEWVNTRLDLYDRKRPYWCDGSARIIHVMNNGGSYWWQPPSDIKHNRGAILQMKKYLEDVLEYGFQILTLELCRNETDAYGRPIVDDVASIGGVEWYCGNDAYHADIVVELLKELGF